LSRGEKGSFVLAAVKITMNKKNMAWFKKPCCHKTKTR
jgi:hypothetical protein